MRFVDFLKTTVLLSAGAATALAAVTVLAAGGHSEKDIVPFALGWWVIAALIGLRLGRRAETNPPIARLLANAKASTTLPEHHPSAILLNRLWPLLLFTLAAGGLAFLAPQVPGHRRRLRDHLGARLATPGRRGGGDRGARRSQFLGAPHLIGASHGARCARPASRPCVPSASNGAIT